MRKEKYSTPTFSDAILSLGGITSFLVVLVVKRHVTG